MQIQDYLRILRNEWWIIIAIWLLAIGGGAAYSYAQTPIYETTATFMVNPGERISDINNLLYSIDTLAGRSTLATTYANILESRVIVEMAATSLNLSSDEILANYRISAVVLPDSNILLLQIRGPSPDLAATLANAIGVAGQEYIHNLQEIYEIRRLDAAVVNPKPTSPNHTSDIGLSVIIGLFSSLTFVILRQALTRFTHSAPPLPNAVSVLARIDDSEARI